MAKKIAIVVAALLAAFLLFAATRPATFHVARTTSIHAPPEKIYPLIADFRGWTSWSPYEGRDPSLKQTYTGADSGKGAVYAWEGNDDVGQGRMEITDVSPPSKVVIKLSFIKPIEAENTAEFTLEPKGSATSVTWAMHGANSFIGKVMSIFVSMDDFIGKDFDKGLAAMKTVAEK